MCGCSPMGRPGTTVWISASSLREQPGPVGAPCGAGPGGRPTRTSPPRSHLGAEAQQPLPEHPVEVVGDQLRALQPPVRRAPVGDLHELQRAALDPPVPPVGVPVVVVPDAGDGERRPGLGVQRRDEGREVLRRPQVVVRQVGDVRGAGRGEAGVERGTEPEVAGVRTTVSRGSSGTSGATGSGEPSSTTTPPPSPSASAPAANPGRPAGRRSRSRRATTRGRRRSPPARRRKVPRAPDGGMSAGGPPKPSRGCRT